MRILPSAVRAVFVVMIFFSLAARGEERPNQLRTTNLSRPGWYEGAMPKGSLLITLQANGVPTAALSVWSRIDPITGSIQNYGAAAGEILYKTKRRLEIDFSPHGKYRGRMSKDGSRVTGRLHAHGFPGVKRINRALRLHYLAPLPPGHGSVLIQNDIRLDYTIPVVTSSP